MAEWKLFGDGTPEVTTAEWYRDREAAPHLEQVPHQARMHKVSDIIHQLFYDPDILLRDVVDLGCGDGGMLSLLQDLYLRAWGYDLQPQNIDYANQVRGVDARYGNFLTDDIEYGSAVICTECIEHLENPHAFLADLTTHCCRWLVASSPNDETDAYHYINHTWAWDMEGYADMITNAGWRIISHENLSPFQVLLAEVAT